MNTASEEVRALRLLKKALTEGFLVSLYPEDDMTDPLHKDSRDYEALKLDVHACEVMTVVIRKTLGSDDDRKRVGASFLLVYGNGEDGPIADHTDNEIGNRFYHHVMG